MKATLLKSLFGAILLLCLGLGAQATITITGPTPVCKGSSGNYSVSPVPNRNYTWSTTAQGNISGANTGSTVAILWGASGTATIKVVADSAGINKDSGTYTVSVLPLPQPVVTASMIVGCQQLSVDSNRKGGQKPDGGSHMLPDGPCIKVCEGSTVSYTANDGLGGSYYSWAVSGATSYNPTGNPCIVTWGSPGFGSLVVKDSTVNGCVSTKTYCIQIIEKPHAKFYALPDSTVSSVSICQDGTIIFINNSTGSAASPIVSYYWDFGDGTVLTSTNAYNPPPVSHQYHGGGTGYQVMLIATNACGCKDTAYMKVDVQPQTGVTIHCPSVVCEGDTATYCIDDPGCGTYNWTFLGSSLPPVNAPCATAKWDKVDSTGFGYVLFDAAGCGGVCPGITTIKVPVILQNGYIFGPSVVCPGKQYIYNMPQWPSTQFNWTISGSTGATLAASDQNNEIVVNTLNPGTFTLKVNYINSVWGCGGTATKIITVLPPVSVTGRVKVCFNDTALYALNTGGTANWTLTWPDGSTTAGSGATFIPTFTQAGSYQLTVSGSFCAPDPLTIVVRPKPAMPDSLLGPGVACSGIPTSYTAKNDAAGSTFAWQAVPGTVAPANGPATYASFTGAGPYVIKVWREDADAPHCASDTLSRTIAPVAINPHITGPDTACQSTYKNYTANYSDGDNYEWSVYPGTLGSIASGNGTQNVQVLWNNVTTSQIVKLIVKVTRCNNTRSDTMSVFVQTIPTFTITGTSPICRGYTQVYGISPVPSSYAPPINWDMGDGTTFASGTSQSYAYNTLYSGNGTPTISVTITNPNGCITTVTANRVISVIPSPVANITTPDPNLFCTAAAINTTMYATVQSGYGTTSGYQWYYNGSPISGATGSSYHALGASPGAGDYYCMVTNSNGCSSATNTITIYVGCNSTSPCIVSPYPTITASLSNDCGHVHAHATYSAGGSGANWTYPAQVISHTTSGGTGFADGDYYFDKAGFYDFFFHVAYAGTGSSGPCVASLDTLVHVTVPYIAGLVHTISCSGSTYNIHVLDHSNYYPPAGGITNYTLYMDGGGTPVQSGSTATNYVLPPTVTTNAYHYFHLVISGGGNPPCDAYDTLFIPATPVASFTMSRTTACVGTAVDIMTNMSTPATGLTYNWDFGDFSYNSQSSPQKVYASIPSSNPAPVVLTVTNQYGCTNTSAPQFVLVVANNLVNGSLTPTPTSPCQGSPVALTWTPGSGSTTPGNFSWYYNSNLLNTGTSPTINVYNSGGYYAIGTNSLGCLWETHTQPIVFVQIPHPVISGIPDQCAGNTFTLDGYAGSDPSYHYQWYLNGSAISGATSASLDQTQYTAGTYNYTLMISVPNGSGSCSDISSAFIVTVHNLPPPPAITYNMLNCNSYQIELDGANPGYTGAYNWSNGQAGTPAYTYTGGPYRLWFTDQYGCVSHSDVSIPKDPRDFLWTFPSGCYTFCKQSLPKYILGPIQSFNYWAWQLGGTPDLYGYNSAPANYPIKGPGDYNLELNNGLCDDISDTMHVSIVDCKQCDGVKWSILKVMHLTTNNGCRDSIVIQFSNSTGMPLAYDISSSNGQLLPPNGTLLPGTNVTTFRYIANPGFSGPTDVLNLQISLPNGRYCYLTLPVQINPCTNSQARYADGNNGDDQSSGATAESSLARMTVAPNPAHSEVVIGYQFSGKGADATRTIEVYDVVGRRMASHTVQDAGGSWHLDVDSYSSGMYLIMLREGGNVLLESKLTITH